MSWMLMPKLDKTSVFYGFRGLLICCIVALGASLLIEIMLHDIGLFRRESVVVVEKSKKVFFYSAYFGCERVDANALFRAASYRGTSEGRRSARVSNSVLRGIF